MITRRDFCLALGAVAATGSRTRRSWGTLPRRQAPFDYQEIRGKGAVILGDGGRVLLMPTGDGPVMIDAKFFHTADDLYEQVLQHVPTPPTLLINTHHHRDHTGGNWRFSPHGELIAHKNLAPRLAGNLAQYRRTAQRELDQLRQSGADETRINSAIARLARAERLGVDDFAPDRLCSGELNVSPGGLELYIRHYGPGHTDNDVVVFLPKLNILHMGDLLFHELHPFIDKAAGATTVGWQRSVREAMKLCNDETIIIPGHGKVTDRTALPKQIEYFDQLRQIVAKAMGEGKSRDETTRMKPDVFKGRGLDRLQSHALGVVYDELSAGS
ncbi:MAG: MBL fold metallo-hydrolase [Planctomycetes bacterium]|nr:MBL fold metallo-hydrolase [Planctomycetota bacterium]